MAAAAAAVAAVAVVVGDVQLSIDMPITLMSRRWNSSDRRATDASSCGRHGGERVRAPGGGEVYAHRRAHGSEVLGEGEQNAPVLADVVVQRERAHLRVGGEVWDLLAQEERAWSGCGVGHALRNETWNAAAARLQLRHGPTRMHECAARPQMRIFEY